MTNPLVFISSYHALQRFLSLQIAVNCSPHTFSLCLRLGGERGVCSPPFRPMVKSNCLWGMHFSRFQWLREEKGN